MAVLSDDMGGITAYAAAVNRGYTGTKEEFEQLMYSYTEVAERAEAAAGNAHESEEGSIEAKDIAVNAKNEAVSARDAAVSARDASISAKNNSESARDVAINAKNDTLAAKDAVMSAKGSVDETSANFSDEVTAAISDVNAAGRNQKELAKTHAVDSEAWAVGQREGADVGVSDETYHNNSKYYAEQSALARDDSVSAKNAAESAKADAIAAKNEAETAKGDAQDIVADINAKSEQIDQNAEDISDLQTAISTKAEIDGNYENLTVGTAEQLIGEVVSEDNTPYIFRKSIAGNSDRLYDQIVGGTVNWNQLAKPFTSDYWSAENNVSVAFADSVATFTSQTTNNGIKSNAQKQVAASHVYYMGFSFQSESASTITCLYGGNGGVRVSFTSATSMTGVYKIAKADASASGGIIYFFPAASGVNVEHKVKNAMLIDLTAMFGSTIADYIYQLEQTTEGAGVVFFKSLFSNDYYTYNAGELVSVSGLSEHKMVGFNQWDEEYVLNSTINPDTGAGMAGDKNIRSKNYIPVIPNTDYYIKSNTPVVIVGYDANMEYVGIIKYGNPNSAFTTNKNGVAIHYIMFGTYGNTYGTTYNHDICINLSDPTKNGTYEPYKAHSYPLDSTLTLRGIPKLVDGKVCFDGDTYDADGTVTRKYGVVDLGTLTYNKIDVAQGTMFRATVSLIKQVANSLNLLCTKYETTTPEDRAEKTLSKSTGANVDIIDSSYTDATSFKTAMSGVMLVYELATPTTEQAQPFTNPQIVDGEGTEEYVTTSIVPVGHVTKYIENLKQKLQDAPQSPSTDGDYIVRQTNGLNEYVPLAPILDTKADVTDFLKAFPTDTVTGAVASFSDGANLPLKSLIVNIDPVQDLNGQANPYPAGGGKNLVALNVSPIREQILSAVTVSEQTEQKLTMESSSTAYACLRLFYHLKAGTYTASVSATASDSYEPAISIYKYSSPYGLIVQGIKSGTPQSFTISEDLDIDIRLFATQETAAARTVTFSNFQIESGSTATAYVPYSNICPISGWSEVNVEHTGKNVCYKIVAGYVSPGADSAIFSTASGTSFIFKCKAGATYIASGININRYVLGIWDSEPKSGDRTAAFQNLGTTPGVPFTAAKDGICVLYVNSGAVDTSNAQVELGSIATAHEQYSGQSINIALGQTVYGGKLDVTNGVLTVDRAGVDLGTLTWSKASTTSGKWRFQATKSDITIATSGGVIPNMICEIYKTVSPDNTYVGVTGVSNNINIHNIFICDLSISEVTALVNVINGKKVVYPLATPLTIQLTPHEVTALLGSNNIWADSGDNEVEYRADPTLYIQRKIAEALANTSDG